MQRRHGEVTEARTRGDARRYAARAGTYRLGDPQLRPAATSRTGSSSHGRPTARSWPWPSYVEGSTPGSTTWSARWVSHGISKSQVSELAEVARTRTVSAFRSRPLDVGYPTPTLRPARLTQKVREGGRNRQRGRGGGHRGERGRAPARSSARPVTTEDGAGWTAFLRPGLVARG